LSAYRPSIGETARSDADIVRTELFFGFYIR
jgi:hypothetical protein